MAENLETYLNQTYSKVERLNNGGYYCYDSNGDRLYVPANYTGSIGMMSYIPGAGGSWPNDAKQLDILIHSNNPPEYIISIAAACSDRNNSLATSYNRLASQGISINSVAEMTFSASSGVGFDRLNSFIAAHPEIDCVMVCNNGVKSNVDNIIRNASKYKALIDSGTPIMLNDPYSMSGMEKRTIGAKNAGFNFFWLKSKSSDHCAFNADIINNRFVDYLLGYRDDFGNTDVSGRRNIDYQLVALDPTTGGLKVFGFDEVTIDALAKIKIPNLDKILAYDKFDIQDKTIPKTETTGPLSELSNILVKSNTGYISSSYYYVYEKMSELRNQIKGSGYLSGLKNTTFRSDTGIPGCIAKYVNAYFDIVSTLLTNLSLESESVISYAQAMVDMDDDMEAGASNLGTVVQLEYAGEKPTSTYVHKETNDIYDGSKKDADAGNNAGNDNNNNNYNSGGYTDPGSSGGGSAPKLMTYEFEDGHRALIKYNGDQIEEFKYMYVFKSELDAKNAYSLFKDAYKDDEMIDKLSVEGTKVYILLKLDKVKLMSVDDIKDKLLKGAKLIND